MTSSLGTQSSSVSTAELSLLGLETIFGWIADLAQSRRAPLLLGYASSLACSTLLHKGPTLVVLVLGRVLPSLSAAAVFAALDEGGFFGPGIAGSLYEVGGENALFGFAYGFIALDATLGLLVIVSASKRAQPGQHMQHITSSDGTIMPFILSMDNSSPSYVPLPKSQIRDEGGGGVNTVDSNINVINTNASQISSFLQLLLLPCLLVTISSWLVWTTVNAGLIFLPFYLPSIAFSPLCGYITDHAPRLLGASGFFLCGPPFILLGSVDDNTTEKQVLLCVLLALIGIGTAFATPPLLKEVGVVVDEGEQNAPPEALVPGGAAARAYSMHNAAFAVGNLLGPILAGTCKAVLGWAAMDWFFAVLSLVSGIAVLVCLEGYIGHVLWRWPQRVSGSGASTVESARPDMMGVEAEQKLLMDK
ncbi:hypothetical protein Sste5346_002269 [Sporothrix stenoceras]|uniref:Major facilitator superfamily (MFS) profile domain-containing protein n=1 Tax=Sporothrix stenoceras TaxID=5173 RepID=A0ABR3ZIR3_9PEZI